MENYEESLGHWVKKFCLLSARKMDSLLAPYGLGRTQWYILHHVNALGRLQQRELQSILDIESATLTPMVATLVKKGWLVQQPSPVDRRTKVLKLTETGGRHFRAVPNPIHLGRRKALAGIDAGEIERARKVIEQAVRNLENGEVA